MPRFKVRDLMIQLPDEAARGGALQPWPGCFVPGYGPSHCGRSVCLFGTCDWGTWMGCPPPISKCAWTYESGPACGEQHIDLEDLRAQLRQALDQVEAQVRVRDEQLAPKTVEEIEQLEQRLNAALEELKARKARLQE